MKGTIQTTPKVLWSQFIGVRNTWITLTPNAASSATANLPVANVPSPGTYQAMLQEWGVRGLLYDLDGTGSLTQIGPSTSDRIFQGSSGYQRVHFDSIFTTCGTNGTCELGGNLALRSRGSWVQAWQSIPMPNLFTPDPIVGDFDNDGALEVAVTPWYDVYLFDLKTGALKQKAPFNAVGSATGRGYGWFGAKDLNGDGKAEFVILGDFENKIGVVGWSGNTLVKLWDHLIEAGIDNKQTVVHPGVDPLQDIDGDGIPEIVLSIFNEHGDNLWHVVAFQGTTGKILLDLPGEHLDGLSDVNGDGVAELMLSAAPAQRLSDATSLRLVSFKGGKVADLWNAKGSAFQSITLQDIPLNMNSSAATGWTTALVGQPAADKTRPFFTRRPVDRSQDIWEISAWKSAGPASVALVGTAQGPGLNVIGTKPFLAGAAGILLQAAVPRSAPGQYSVQGFDAKIIYSETNNDSLTIPVVGTLSPGANPTVVVQTTSGNQIVALQPGVQSTNGQPKVLWSHSGRGHFVGHTGYTGVVGFGGVVLADLFGNGNIATLLATTGPNGQARLSAIAPDGAEYWNADFDRFPGGVPLWNNPGLLTWLPGRFRFADRDDVLISLRRSTQHSEELWLLDGRTGVTVWSRTYGPTPTPGGNGGDGGGGWMAVYDWNGDGLDEAVNFIPRDFWVVDGTGKNLIDRTLFHGVFPGIDSFYGVAITEDYFRDATFSFLYGGSSYAYGLVSVTGEQIWRTPPEVRPPGYTPAIADLKGDGNLAAVTVGELIPGNSNQSNIVARDAKTGAQLWTLTINAPPFDASGNPTGASPSAAISADLAGDGRDEIIFTSGNAVFAVGASPNGSSGRILWQITMPSDVSMPAIADVYGDGRLQILVVSFDGNIYGIGDASPAGAAQTVTFNGLSSHVFGTDAFPVSATATSGLAVSFSSTTEGICSVSGATVTLRGAGVCTVVASQSGNAVFNPAVPIARSFRVAAPLLAATQGSGQSAAVNNTFATLLKATVRDPTGNLMPGVSVTFTAPATGASGTFTAAATVKTDSSGLATAPPLTANATPGSYVVTANVSGGLTPATFTLTNTGGATITPGGIAGVGGSVPSVQALSQNALVSIYGQNFLPAGTAGRRVVASEFVNGGLPTSLLGVCVDIGGQRAAMLDVYPTQINAQVPAVTGDTADVRVLTNCGTPTESASNPQTVPVRIASPEFLYFQLNSSGRNPIAAFNPQTGAYVGPSNLGGSFTPAHVGDVLTAFATGFGPLTPPLTTGQIPTRGAPAVGPVSVTIGGVTLAPSDIVYAGAAPGQVIDQVNFRIPAGIPPGNQPIVISVAGISSPPNAFIPIQ